MFTKIYNAMKTKRYVFERETYKQETRQLLKQLCKLHYYIYSLFEVFQKTGFVFFVYLKEK